MSKKILKFIKATGPYASGELAGFPPDEAAQYVSLGRAEYYREAPAKPKKDKMMRSTNKPKPKPKKGDAPKDLDGMAWAALWSLASDIASQRGEDVEEVMGGRKTEHLKSYIARYRE